MKLLNILVVIFFSTFLFVSCGLFKGGGGGSHCPAYGTSLDNNIEKHSNEQKNELRLNESKSI